MSSDSLPPPASPLSGSAAIDPSVAAIHATARDSWPWKHFMESGAQTERQQQLMKALAHSPEPLTQREMFKAAREFGYPDMTNGSRVSELVRSGAIRVAGRRSCRITGHGAFSYCLTGTQPNKPKHDPVKDTLVLYAALRDGLVVRIASHPLKPKAGEVVAFFTADRRRSSKDADGTSLLPHQLQDFGFTLFSPTEPGVAGRRRMRPDDGQPELSLAPAGAEAGA